MKGEKRTKEVEKRRVDLHVDRCCSYIPRLARYTTRRGGLKAYGDADGAAPAATVVIGGLVGIGVGKGWLNALIRGGDPLGVDLCAVVTRWGRVLVHILIKYIDFLLFRADDNRERLTPAF